MPEYPDVVVYVEHLRRRLVGQTLEKIRIASPFVLRSADPPVARRRGQPCSWRFAPRKADHPRAGERSVPRFSFDDRRQAALACKGRKNPRAPWVGGFRFRERHAAAHRGQLEETSLPPPGARPEPGQCLRSRRT